MQCFISQMHPANFATQSTMFSMLAGTGGSDDVIWEIKMYEPEISPKTMASDDARLLISERLIFSIKSLFRTKV